MLNFVTYLLGLLKGMNNLVLYSSFFKILNSCYIIQHHSKVSIFPSDGVIVFLVSHPLTLFIVIREKWTMFYKLGTDQPIISSLCS